VQKLLRGGHVSWGLCSVVVVVPAVLGLLMCVVYSAPPVEANIMCAEEILSLARAAAQQLSLQRCAPIDAHMCLSTSGACVWTLSVCH
jgi:hypothetical protein